MPDDLPLATAPATDTAPPAPPPAAPDTGAPPPAQAEIAPPAEASPKPDAGEPTVEPTWRDDWRERMAGDDQELLRHLKRFNSPENVAKSFADAQRKIRSGEFRKQLSPEATPEEVAAYRKEVGIPETPDGYEIKLPEGVEVSDADKAVIDAFKPVFHGRNIAPDVANGLVNDFMKIQAAAAQQMYEQAVDKTINYKAEIRAELGREFEPALRVATSWMDQTIGQEKRASLVEATLADGTKLGDHPDFVRLWVNAGKVASGDGLLLDGKGTIESDPKGKLNALINDKMDGKIDAATYEKEARRLADQMNALARRAG